MRSFFAASRAVSRRFFASCSSFALASAAIRARGSGPAVATTSGSPWRALRITITSRIRTIEVSTDPMIQRTRWRVSKVSNFGVSSILVVPSARFSTLGAASAFFFLGLGAATSSPSSSARFFLAFPPEPSSSSVGDGSARQSRGKGAGWLGALDLRPGSGGSAMRTLR